MKWKSLNCAWLFRIPWPTQSMEFSRPEYWREGPFPSPEDLPNSGIEPSSPALQVDSLPTEPQEKPKNTGVGAYPFSSGSSWPRNLTGVSCITGRFFTNWPSRKPLDNSTAKNATPSASLINMFNRNYVTFR